VTPEAAASALSTDHRSGATTLFERAAGLLLDEIDGGTSGANLGALAVALVRAQPAMAPVARVASSALIGYELGGLSAARTAVRNERSRMHRNHRRLVAAAAEHIQPFVRILTLSASSTVRDVLLEAKQRNVRFFVTCLESRPLREGVDLARELAAAGIDVTLAVDASMGIAVGEADAVMLGADTLAASGLVHKIGAWPLCLAAGELGVPVFVLAGPEKLLPDLVKRALEQQREPAEVDPDPPSGVKLVNRTFDFTPLEQLDGVFLGGTLLEPEKIPSRTNRIELHQLIEAELVS
jgi:translation initiation factor 2B subunit (eIF-2B alpha/beta/delta family)